MRRPEDRNRDGANLNEIFLFNQAINKLDLIEIPLHGRQFTWTNKQYPPLLERLDWFFTSTNRTTKYPDSIVTTLCMEVSDHWPCVVEIATSIPKPNIFRFENHWLHHDDFINTAVQGWKGPAHINDPAKLITAKYKNLRGKIKDWRKTLPNLALTIDRIKPVLHFLESLELIRDLSLQEWNFRSLVSEKLIQLLKQQRTYWKQRGKIRWVREGDAATRYFHANATIRHRINKITSLKDEQGGVHTAHEHKALLLWNAFKSRMGGSEYSGMDFNLIYLIQQTEGLDRLETPFTRQEIEQVIAKLPNNKSPGPDDFTNEFIKGYWPLIGSDFIQLCKEF